MSRRALALAALVALLTSCAAAVPSPSASDPAPSATPASTQSSIPSPDAEGLALPEPGRPLDATTLLAAMRDSRRPGGVPDELETDAVASAVAEAIWTFAGEPWATMSAGGSCGPETCTLEISGADDGAQGDDLWVFEVVPSTGAIEVTSADLRSLSPDLIGRLDERTRSLFPSGTFEGLSLTNVRWLPPPDDGRFVLSYRSGGEETSCGTDITVDALVPEIVSDLPLDCR